MLAILLSIILLVSGPQYVNDYADVLTPEQETELTAIVKDYEKKTTTQIVVVIPKSLEGRSIEEYGLKIGREWGVGTSDLNNGLVLVVAPNDRKYRLEIGTGLEGYITDGQAGQIMRENLVPQLKEGDYYSGIKESLTAITGHLGELTPEQRLERQKKREQASDLFKAKVQDVIYSILIALGSIVGLLLLPIYVFSKLRKRRLERKRLNSLKLENTEKIEKFKAENEQSLLDFLVIGVSDIVKLKSNSAFVAETYARKMLSYNKNKKSLDETQEINLKEPDQACACLHGYVPDGEELGEVLHKFAEDYRQAFSELADAENHWRVLREELSNCLEKHKDYDTGIKVPSVDRFAWVKNTIDPQRYLKKIEQGVQRLEDLSAYMLDSLRNERENAENAEKVSESVMSFEFDKFHEFKARIKKDFPEHLDEILDLNKAKKETFSLCEQSVAYYNKSNKRKFGEINECAEKFQESLKALEDLREVTQSSEKTWKELSDLRKTTLAKIKELDSVGRVYRHDKARKEYCQFLAKLDDLKTAKSKNWRVLWTDAVDAAETLEKSDSLEKKEDRRIAQEEEERAQRKRRQEDDDRRRREESSYSSSSSSYSGGGGGFSGGGGSFGGGGASGSW